MDEITYVIDTNVLLHDPDAIGKFEGAEVILPMAVVEELDRKKKQRDELGSNARLAIRSLDDLRTSGRGDFIQGISFNGGTRVRITSGPIEALQGLSPTSPENKSILTAYALQKEGKKVAFISKNFAARVKAAAIGIEARDYWGLKFSYEQICSPIESLEVAKREIDLFYKDGKLELPSEVKPSYANQYYRIESKNPPASTLAKYDQKSGNLINLLSIPPEIWGIKPVNLEQTCAFDLLLRDDISLVTLVGAAGTGKTLLALTAALRKVFDEALYSRILVTRPIVPLGKDIGYLPGTKEEKLSHWMQPIADNLEFLCQSMQRETQETLQWILEGEKVELEAVTYIRGRTLANVYMIIDEAQNLTPHEIKTIISRSGKGTKVVLTGDPTQIDNPYLDENSNGLTFAVKCFKDQSLFGHAYLQETARSKLAQVAVEVM